MTWLHHSTTTLPVPGRAELAAYCTLYVPAHRISLHPANSILCSQTSHRPGGMLHACAASNPGSMHPVARCGLQSHMDALPSIKSRHSHQLHPCPCSSSTLQVLLQCKSSQGVSCSRCVHVPILPGARRCATSMFAAAHSLPPSTLRPAH